MAVKISVDDMVVELLEEGDPVGDTPSVDADDASWEFYVRMVVAEATEDALLLAGVTDPSKLAIQIEVLNNSGVPRSDSAGALPILNDAQTPVGIISQVGSLAVPAGTIASIDPTNASKPIELQVKRLRRVTVCIWSKVHKAEICRTHTVSRLVDKPTAYGPGDALPAGTDHLTLKSSGKLDY